LQAFCCGIVDSLYWCHSVQQSFSISLVDSNDSAFRVIRI
jgi:hypothetical protein